MRKILSIIAVSALMCVLLAGAAFSNETSNAAQGAAYITVGYCEGESYYEFDYTLHYLLVALQEKGLIDTGEIPSDANSKELWDFLSAHDQSKWRIRFVNEAFFSLNNAEYADMTQDEIRRYISGIIERNNINLMWTNGTRAGLMIKSLDGRPAMMNFCAANPLASGIVEDDEYSGVENIWAHMDPDAFSRSLSVMYDLFSPRSIGVVYEDSEEAYIYSGIKVLEEICAANGIKLYAEFVDDPLTDGDYQEYLDNLTAAYDRLSSKIDLFVLTTSLVEGEDFVGLFRPLFRANIPIFSINSTDDVRYGALMAVESSDYRNIGRFSADQIMRFIMGDPLETLPQIYQTAPYLVINYSTARIIGYKPSFSMLLIANYIFH